MTTVPKSPEVLEHETAVEVASMPDLVRKLNDPDTSPEERASIRDALIGKAQTLHDNTREVRA